MWKQFMLGLFFAYVATAFVSMLVAGLTYGHTNARALERFGLGCGLLFASIPVIILFVGVTGPFNWQSLARMNKR